MMASWNLCLCHTKRTIIGCHHRTRLPGSGMTADGHMERDGTPNVRDLLCRQRWETRHFVDISPDMMMEMVQIQIAMRWGEGSCQRRAERHADARDKGGFECLEAGARTGPTCLPRHGRPPRPTSPHHDTCRPTPLYDARLPLPAVRVKLGPTGPTIPQLNTWTYCWSSSLTLDSDLLTSDLWTPRHCLTCTCCAKITTAPIQANRHRQLPWQNFSSRHVVF